MPDETKEMHEKLTDQTNTVANLARARANVKDTDGKVDQALVDHLEGMIIRVLGSGVEIANEIILTEAMTTLDDSLALAQFYAVRRDVLALLKSDEPSD